MKYDIQELRRFYAMLHDTRELICQLHIDDLLSAKNHFEAYDALTACFNELDCVISTLQLEEELSI